ncbi:MAG: N-acetyltransferase family protein [Chloroflexota bacterium]
MDKQASKSFTIRSATTQDAAALLAIYRPYVEGTAVSFEQTPPTVAEFAARIEKAVAHWAWLVAEANGQLVGFAYGSTHRARAAYAHSVETSAYIHPNFQRGGIARALYNALFVQLQLRGYESAYAGITLPNDASVGFHRSLGFASIGTFPKVGRKFDQWHDVAWFYRPVQLKTSETMNSGELAALGNVLAAELLAILPNYHVRSDEHNDVLWESDILKEKANVLLEGGGVGVYLKDSVFTSGGGARVARQHRKLGAQIQAFHEAFATMMAEGSES